MRNNRANRVQTNKKFVKHGHTYANQMPYRPHDCGVHITSLVIYSPGDGHTHTHTQTRIPVIHTEAILRNQAHTGEVWRAPAAGLKITINSE